MALTHSQIIQHLLSARLRLMGVAWLVVHDVHLAEDIFQTVSVKALEPGHSFPNESSLLAWSRIVTRREGLQWLRRHRRESVGFDEDVLDLLAMEWDHPGGQEAEREIAALTDCMEHVPAASRRLLELRYFEKRPCGEVATELGCRPEAVYQRLARLHRVLKGCIESRLREPLPHTLVP